MFKFLGSGKDLKNAAKITYETPQTVYDFHNRPREIPMNVEVKHFETTNKCWLVWRDEVGLHITDLG